MRSIAAVRRRLYDSSPREFLRHDLPRLEVWTFGQQIADGCRVDLRIEDNQEIAQGVAFFGAKLAYWRLNSGPFDNTWSFIIREGQSRDAMTGKPQRRQRANSYNNTRSGISTNGVGLHLVEHAGTAASHVFNGPSLRN